MKKRMTIRFLCLLAAVCMYAGGAAAETAKPKPTVRPMPYRIDYSLPHTKLTVENVEKYFNIELGKEYTRGGKLSIPFYFSPKEAYDQYDGSSPRIVVRLEISVFLNEEDTEPYFTKTYAVLLYREKGFVGKGVIEVLLKLDQDDVRYTCEITGCNGRIGLEGWVPEPESEPEAGDAENEAEPAV